MLLPWRATCIQTLNHVVNDVSTREEALAIIHRSLDRWESFIAAAVAGRGWPSTTVPALPAEPTVIVGKPVSFFAQPAPFRPFGPSISGNSGSQ